MGTKRLKGLPVPLGGTLRMGRSGAGWHPVDGTIVAIDWPALQRVDVQVEASAAVFAHGVGVTDITAPARIRLYNLTDDVAATRELEIAPQSVDPLARKSPSPTACVLAVEPADDEKDYRLEVNAGSDSACICAEGQLVYVRR